MKTQTYQNFLYRAAELAQRTRDKIPAPSETLMFQMFVGMEFMKMWDQVDWPELCDNLTSYTPVNTNGILTVSKNEGSTNPAEIGDVLGVYTNDPRGMSVNWKELDWWEANGQIYVKMQAMFGTPPNNQPSGPVWIDWQLPAPDLTTISDPVVLAATMIPIRFYMPLCMAGAGWMLQQDGKMQEGQAMLALSQQELDRQSAKIKRPPWRDHVKMRKNC